MEAIIIIVVVIFIINLIGRSQMNQMKKRSQEDAQLVRDAKAARRSTLAEQLEEQRRVANAERRTISPTVRPTVQPSGAGWRCVCGRDNAQGSAYCVKCGRRREEAMSGSLVYNSNEGRGARGSLAYSSTEGMAGGGDMEGYSTEGRDAAGELVAAKPSLRHTVRPATESGHSHTESSMTGGGEACAEEYDQYTHDGYDQKGDAYSQKTADGYAQKAGDAYAIGREAQGLPFGLRLNEAGDLARGLLYAEILGKPKALRSR